VPGRGEHGPHPGPVRAPRRAATFFTLGWIAERYPQVVRRIVAGGHELASHGYGHLRASDQTRAEFANDIRSAKALLEDIGGQAVLGYRAPSFSIGRANLWALDELLEAGYRYSSSIYPIAHDHYGMPDAPRFAFYPNGPDGLLEVPITTVRMMGRNLPAGGGGYFRLLPYALSRWMMAKVNRDDRQPALFYFHPWEIDPGSRAPKAWTPSRASATTSTSTAWKTASKPWRATSPGTAWTAFS
jgi:polysaccharide deacetylase family protein (PEP-CTERM system associated)